MSWKSRWPKLATLTLLLCASSCSSASKYVKNVFQKEDHPPVAAAEKDAEQATPEVKHAYTAGKKDETKVQPLAHSQKESAKPTAEGDRSSATAKPESTETILDLIAKGKDPFADSAVQPASNEQVAPPPEEKVAASDPIQHSAPPREPLSAELASASMACPPANACPPTAPCGARPFPGAEFTGDEYVCDGGDKGEPVHYEGMNRAGLGVEDTIAEFKDDAGNIHMQPSTQACIYAPRFGSVSTATLPEQGLSVAKAVGHQDQSAAGGLETKMIIDEKTQTDEAVGMQVRSRASGLNNKQTENQLHQMQTAGSQVKLLNAYEDFRFIREGQFELADRSVIALGVTAAQEWADGRRPIIIAKDAGGQIVQGRFTAQDYTGVEDKRTPGELKLVKVADKASAHPGEIVTFTIRFDNIGGRDLTNLRLVDNLSPRLEYVEGSINSNLDGKIDVDDNGVGGKLLTFEFEQPLKGKTGGFVSFECRVR